MVDIRYHLKILLIIITTVLVFCSTATSCPVECLCVTKVDNTMKVECTNVASMPDSSLFPANANEFIVTFTGHPGIPAGAFTDLTDVKTITVSGEIGDIKTGAFKNLKGNSAFSEISVRNYGLSSSADVKTVEAEAFSYIEGFYSITFVYAIIDKLSTNAFSNLGFIWGITFQYVPINIMEDTAFNNVVGGQSRSRLNFLYSSISTFEGCAFIGLDQWYEIYFFQSSVTQLESFAFAGISNIEFFKLESLTVTDSSAESYNGMGSVSNFVLSSVNPTPIISSDPSLENSTIAKLTARDSCNDYTTIAVSSSQGPSSTALRTSGPTTEPTTTVQSTALLSDSASEATIDDNQTTTTTRTTTTTSSPSSTASSLETTTASTKSSTTATETKTKFTVTSTQSKSPTTTTTKQLSTTSTTASATTSQTTTGTIKTPNAGASTDDSSSTIGVLEIVLIIILILLVLIVILLIVFLIVCWKRQNKQNKVVPEATKTTQTGSQYGDYQEPKMYSKDARPVAVIPNGYDDGNVHYFKEKNGSQEGLVPEKRRSKKKKKKRKSENEYDQPISYSVTEPSTERGPPPQPRLLQPEPYYDEISERETYRTPSPKQYRPVRRPKHGESKHSNYSANPRAPEDSHFRSYSSKEPELMTYRSSYDADDYEPVYTELEPQRYGQRAPSPPEPNY